MGQAVTIEKGTQMRLEEAYLIYLRYLHWIPLWPRKWQASWR